MFSLFITFNSYIIISSSILVILFGRFLGNKGGLFISCTGIWISTICTFWLFNTFSFSDIFIINFFKWIDLPAFKVYIGFELNNLIIIFLLIILIISSLVHLYSTVYMFYDPYVSRFINYLSFFTWFMVLLVSSNNLLVLFIGWEVVGLCSYLLISFWYTRIQAGKSATKAFLFNKVGDLFFLVSICFFIILINSLVFQINSVLLPYLYEQQIEIISLFFFIGVCGKSAQIGLHAWLPDAMEGPTPVSALLHAATMVTAGIFLIIRCSNIFEYITGVSYFITVWGGISAIIAGSIGSVQNDIKKIIAYSTCSQLGYMVIICGASQYNISFFHLFNHAFFKALLFLSAGSIIHILNGEQDIRKMGGMAKLSPFIYICMLIASLSLIGFPFTSGFYSKDLIIEYILTQFWVSDQFLYWLVLISALLTVIYSLQLLNQVFWGTFNGFKTVIYNSSKISYIEIIVLLALGIFSLISGYIFRDFFVGLGSNYFNWELIVFPNDWKIISIEFISFSLKLLPVLFVFTSVEFNSSFIVCKYYFNDIIHKIISIPLLNFGRHFYDQIEKVSIETNLLGFFNLNFIIKY